MNDYLFDEFKMLNYINDPVYIHKVNPNTNIPGNFVFVNNAAVGKMGYSFDEFMNLSPTDIDDTSRIENIPKIIKKLKENKDEIFETKHITKTGEKYDVELSSKIIRLNNDPNLYIISVARDITKRKKLEYELNKFKKLADNSTSGVCFLDLNEKIVYINDYMAEIHGYTPDELLGKKWKTLHFKENYDKLDNLIQKLYETGYLESIKMPHKKKSGEALSILSNIVYIKTDLGAIMGVTSRDLSDEEKIIQNLIEAKNKAVEANKAKEIFLANINHELKTPLTGLLGTLSILKESDCTEQNKNFFEMMEKSANTLKDLVNKLLLSSEIKFSHVKKNFSWISFENIFNELKTKYSEEAKNKNLVFKAESQNLDKIVKTDVIMVEEIIENLLNNACKFTEKGFIEFSMVLKNRVLEIIVKDSGVGIDEEYLKNLFNEFSQQDLSYTKKYEGLGLGLFLTKKYINMLKGNISVETSTKGTKFVVKIPVEIKTEENKKIDFNNKKILITEDNSINLELMKEFLNDENFLIDTAADGEEAFKKYEQNKYDLLLMDIQIKKINGLEVIKKIRKKDDSTPILAISGFTRPEDRFKFILAGANDFLPKPYTKEELISFIKKLIK
ncbi:response regulator [Geotoga petraea]|jgi:PAS domain S-box-containing protein|uniref:histidine kinase n=1 Tax=Geotoga petraea TaxID=28234 RepID=A0A4Z0W6S4_9BACT|nr:response regulator [Geotoga petraea]TGG88824.1 PAS domain-containing sensor histidine kinase [Geotoga petraea]